MFITPDELRSAIYAYQLSEITESDDTIAQMAISAGIEHVKSYLRGHYDTDIIFSATGTDRNALVMEVTKDIAVWHIVRLSNVDMLYEHVRDRYDRAMTWLRDVAATKIAPDLPLPTTPDGEAITKLHLGSNPKFYHYY